MTSLIFSLQIGHSPEEPLHNSAHCTHIDEWRHGSTTQLTEFSKQTLHSEAFVAHPTSSSANRIDNSDVGNPLL